MKGSYLIEVKNKKINYRLKFNRKITIIKGKSSSGKTELCTMIDKSYMNPSIKIISDIKIINLSGKKEDYILFELNKNSNSLIIFDEESQIYNNKYFARYIKDSDNYFLFITRNNIDSIPYSYKEVYKLKYDKNTNTNYMERFYEDVNLNWS